MRYSKQSNLSTRSIDVQTQQSLRYVGDTGWYALIKSSEARHFESSCGIRITDYVQSIIQKPAWAHRPLNIYLPVTSRQRAEADALRAFKGHPPRFTLD